MRKSKFISAVILLITLQLFAQDSVYLPLVVNSDASVTASLQGNTEDNSRVFDMKSGIRQMLALPILTNETALNLVQSNGIKDFTLSIRGTEIRLNLPRGFVQGEVTLYSLAGREVSKVAILENSNSRLTKNLSSGIYLLELTSFSGQRYTQKISLAGGSYHFKADSFRNPSSMFSLQSSEEVMSELSYSFRIESKNHFFRDSVFTLTLFKGMNSEVQVELLRKNGKKGVCKTIKTDGWESIVESLNPYWHYSWGWELKDEEPSNVEFIPMIWGRSSKLDERIPYLKELAADGKISYLLGFNEPDGAKQADMTVDEAIKLWPHLESVGVPLGSPAVVNAENEWLAEFMAKAEEEQLRVDFITVHYYGGTSATAFMNKLKRIYNLYQKPLWITEFAAADWRASTTTANRYTPEAVLSYMKELLPQLEEAEYIHRYSWFSFEQDRPEGWSSALYDAMGNLTPLGEYYAQFTGEQ